MCKETIFTALQYVLPHHAFSRLVGYLAECKNEKFKTFAIEKVIRRYNVDLSDAEISDIAQFPNFNDFFTRALKKGVRTFPKGGKTLASPADGAISQQGQIHNGKLIQAKGIDYGIFELLGGEFADIHHFKKGVFSTIYLSPRDYHRVHIPMEGKHLATTYIPGRLFSVNPATTTRVEGLFTRNERVAMFYETKHGKMAVVMVGAMLVAGIETVAEGLVTPQHRSDIVHYDYTEKPKTFKCGDEIGRFKFGSTAIVLHENPDFQFSDEFGAGKSIRLGNNLAAIG